jgi:hypothetical protein
MAMNRQVQLRMYWDTNRFEKQAYLLGLGECNLLGGRLFLPAIFACQSKIDVVKMKGFIRLGALNSAVECHLHTVEVTGSSPVAPTISFSQRQFPQDNQNDITVGNSRLKLQKLRF